MGAPTQRSSWQQLSSNVANHVYVNRFNFLSVMQLPMQTSGEKITSYERVSKAWTSDQVLKHVNDAPNYGANSGDGPTPMEVDRVEKGKGKSKHKGKGRGSSSGNEWVNAWMYGRGRGRGRANKGKGKGKSKGKNKGKKGNQKGGSSKGKKGGGRGKVAYGQCSNCYEFGHWSRECPNMVNQVGKQEPVAPNQATSSTAPAAKAFQHCHSQKDFSIWKSCSFLKPVFTNFSSFLQWFPGAYGTFP